MISREDGILVPFIPSGSSLCKSHQAIVLENETYQPTRCSPSELWTRHSLLEAVLKPREVSNVSYYAMPTDTECNYLGTCGYLSMLLPGKSDLL